MIDAMDSSTIAIIFTGIGLVVMLVEKIFGGGNKLASAFSSLKESTTKEITDLRLEFLQKIELRDNNARVGFEAVTANMHIIKEALLENRAQVAENYMRRDSYYKASDELKRDFKEKHDDLKDDMNKGFAALKDQLDAMAQAIELGRMQTAKQTRTHT
jgi:hypothetical protein